MRLTKRKVCFPSCDKQGNLTKVDYIEIKNKKLAEEKLCKLEDLMEIISNKPIDIGLNIGSVMSNEPKRYSITIYDLTEEECDLWKEELEWKL